MSKTLAALVGAARAASSPIIFLTGAGLSAQSGIPTFRGPEGYWSVGSRHYRPQELATRSAFAQMPREVWRWYLYRLGVCRSAQPNPAHLALVELEHILEDRFRLVTQNVDGLHLRAGQSPKRTHCIHGNIEHMRCYDGCCDELIAIPPDLALNDRDEALSDESYARLRCPRCEGLARPHVLWFDESYDESLFAFDTVVALSRAACLLISIGTSGATNLPMQVAMNVARRGTPIIDINPDTNPFADLARRTGGVAWQEPAALAVPELARHFAAHS